MRSSSGVQGRGVVAMLSCAKTTAAVRGRPSRVSPTLRIGASSTRRAPRHSIALVADRRRGRGRALLVAPARPAGTRVEPPDARPPSLLLPHLQGALRPRGAGRAAALESLPALRRPLARLAAGRALLSAARPLPGAALTRGPGAPRHPPSRADRALDGAARAPRGARAGAGDRGRASLHVARLRADLVPRAAAPRGRGLAAARLRRDPRSRAPSRTASHGVARDRDGGELARGWAAADRLPALRVGRVSSRRAPRRGRAGVSLARSRDVGGPRDRRRH